MQTIFTLANNSQTHTVKNNLTKLNGAKKKEEITFPNQLFTCN